MCEPVQQLRLRRVGSAEGGGVGGVDLRADGVGTERDSSRVEALGRGVQGRVGATDWGQQMGGSRLGAAFGA